MLPGDPDSSGLIDLLLVDTRRLWAFVAVNVDGGTTPELVVERTWAALKGVSNRVAPGDGRVVPLIGVPLVGTGEGGLGDCRGEVIKLLLRRYHEMPLQADVALILFERRDFAAVQECRGNRDWPNLPAKLRHCADELGNLAAAGELSLFLGAGVSRPAGLPDWWKLLDDLAPEAGKDLPSRQDDPFDAAEPIVQGLGLGLQEAVRQRLDVRKHGVGHALMASLRVKRMVTTNYDRCMELALDNPFAKDFQVLTRQVAKGKTPWLLKLNGDITPPGTVLLSRSDLEQNPDERRALEGVVQSLLLTSHLFFVGFSLTDSNFLKLAQAVSAIRSRAKGVDRTKSGTAVGLTDEDCGRARYKDLKMVSMKANSPGEGARLLEIFLDRLVWRACKGSDLSSEYLLDGRYASGLSKPDLELRDALIDMRDNLSTQAMRTTGWERVAKCLRDLGDDSYLVPGDASTDA